MTRHTPQFVQARSSQLSLRSLALEQSQASRAASIADAPFPRVNAKEMKPESFTKPYCEFMTANPTVFHSVQYFKDKLTSAGYKEVHSPSPVPHWHKTPELTTHRSQLPSRDSWAGKLEPGGKYYVTRNGSSIIAFSVGKAYKPGNGAAMVAGHIDALTARLKPTSTKPLNNGYIQLGVAPYAGSLNETWWDRDLSIGGRVVVRDPDTGKTSIKLAKLDWPIARIPTLAPHFGIGMMGQNNRETQAVPIIGLDNSDLFPNATTPTPAQPLGGPGSFVSTQPPKLVKLISKELGLSDPSAILNWELELYDSQPAQVGGLDKEFIFAGRIDDKLCSWAAFMALLHANHSDTDGVIKLVALFDDEEIGSLLRQGARGNFLPITLERAVESLSASASSSTPFGPGLMGQTFARSFLVSSDVTHAAHPNFTQTNLAGHSPRLNVGVALCVDASAHMTTDTVSMAILDRVAELAGCVNQRHMIRNDSRSGGTVGPMLSAAMGCKAADVGIPQLSMHSVRATTGSLDPGLGLKFYKGFLDHWEEVDGEWH